ncbi:MAG: hypothetical protein LC130_07785 [Bryobacterales bacterium]|nr:hypothetical protein [Bryobacterales bacterium]
MSRNRGSDSKVLEKGQIVDRGLDPEKEAELVVEFQRHRSHHVFDPGALNANVKPVAHLTFVLGVELAAQEGGDVVRLDRVDCGPRQVAVDGSQIGLPPEDDVGGVLALVHAPVIGHAESAVNRAIGLGKLVQLAVQSLDLPAVGDLLGSCPIRNFDKRVVDEFIADLLLAQPGGQPIVAVEVDLQPAGQPRRHPYVAQPQLIVDEIEVVVQTLAVVRPQVRLAALLVVPGLVGRAPLHRREDAHQPGLLPAQGENLLHPVFLPHIALAQKLNLDPVGRRQPLGVLAQLISKRFSKPRVVEDPDLPLVEERRHPLGVADLRQCAEYQHPVPTTQHSRNLILVPFRQ